ncbi:Detected protein of confused Function [Hibiscus syriacus]|uniref:Detected protein of confused Function n=1 Tax=Hibiscus syriacus TaxID=106335 RepID=A0A6A3B483_HIBSY|nr:Detected protein of confused Function [Hibiscus syriacus]
MKVAAGCCLFELPSDNRTGREAAMPQSHYVQVPHINQLFSWDCGLACVLMVLTTVGINSYSIQNLIELCSTTRFSYYTVTFGANPNYSRETYYKEHLPSDLVRVDKLFQKAVEAGINRLCRSISKEEISRWIMSGKYIVIALVDLCKLSGSWVGDVIIPGFHGNDAGYTA